MNNQNNQLVNQSESPPPENILNAAGESNAVLSLIERVALDPNVDIDKLEKMLELQTRIFDKNAEIAFNTSMAKVQGLIQPIARDADNDQTSSKYARLESIVEAITPIYSEHGFALSFGEADCPKEGWYRVECEVTHSAGFSKKTHVDLPLDDKGIHGKVNKTGLHGFGSTMAYGRRYITLMIFNIATKYEDNDGNGRKQLAKSEGLFVTPAQLKVLRKTLKDADVTEKDFCRKAQIEKIELLPQQRMAGGIRMLAQFKAKENKA